jgi:hypothetical protein
MMAQQYGQYLHLLSSATSSKISMFPGSFMPSVSGLGAGQIEGLSKEVMLWDISSFLGTPIL